jgi:cation diffusion facilitator CzcD-associated flavoprotein CzcO/uncharacterized protein YcgI (DUF1989 family)
VHDHARNQTYSEPFDYVVVATGHFSIPNVPEFPGFSHFGGRVLHAHDFRDALEFKGKDVLIVGASYSAEDIGSQCYKYGARSITSCYRTNPMGYDWPDNWEEKPNLTHVEGKRVFFQDGSSKQIDAIILCTGYLHHFPFIDEDLRLKTNNRLWPLDLYKGIFWERNPRMMYIGMQDQWYSFNMFDAQAWYARDVVLGRIKLPDYDAMHAEDLRWREEELKLQTAKEMYEYQGEYIRQLIEATDYPTFDIDAVNETFLQWKHDKAEDIMGYRNKCYRSVMTGSMAIPTTRRGSRPSTTRSRPTSARHPASRRGMRTAEGWLRHVAACGDDACLETLAGDRLRLTDPEGGQAGELLLATVGSPPSGVLWSVLPEAEAPAWLLGAAGEAYRADLFGPTRRWAAPSGSTSRSPPVWCCAHAAHAWTPTARIPSRLCWPRSSRPGRDAVRRRQRWPNRCSTCASMPARRSPYRVRAGDYIQVIDVDGRQCSDFQAFHAGDLAAGVESAIDPTTTRTLMGTSSPGPGLHSRFFDPHQRPLVEVVRDTVGRHDTFMLACSAKYYEDMGYPGHANCSANFNAALAPHGVDAAGRLARHQLLLQHHLPGRRHHHPRRAVVAAGRLRPAARARRSGLRLVRLPRRHRPRQRLGADRHPCAHLFRCVQFQQRHRVPHESRLRTAHHPRDRLPCRHQRSHPAHGRVPRLLAAGILLRQRCHRRVLGLPRTRGADRPVAAAQVRDHRTGCRGTGAGGGDA